MAWYGGHKGKGSEKEVEDTGHADGQTSPTGCREGEGG